MLYKIPIAFRGLYHPLVIAQIKLILALAGTTFFPWYIQQPKLMIPLSLGVIAGSLSEVEESLHFRWILLIPSLVLFFTASATVELLFHYPLGFGFWLIAFVVGSLILGAFGPRFGLIGFVTLLIAIYTMLGVPLYEYWYQQPLLLILGVVWFHALASMIYLFCPLTSSQRGIVDCYEHLVAYLSAKAELFDPDDLREPIYVEHQLIQLNSQLVGAMNQMKSLLLSRIYTSHLSIRTSRVLREYFLIQDIHERVSSIHIDYQELSKNLVDSALLFRFQRILRQLALCCQGLALYILNPSQKLPDIKSCYLSLQRVEHEIAVWITSTQDDAQSHLLKVQVLTRLFGNLSAIAKLLEKRMNDKVYYPLKRIQLEKDNISSWSEFVVRLKANLTSQSPTFRHAVRVSIMMLASYVLIHFSELEYGYWVMLTGLFVCQLSYSATKQRLFLRVSGTVLGIIIGIPILYFVPSLVGRMLLIIIFGTLFFRFKDQKYAFATLFITLFVFLLFSSVTDGFSVFIPRLIDTLIGCGIAWLVSYFVWPDWHFRNLDVQLRNALFSNLRYLQEVVRQYHSGKTNDLQYRIARRGAHNGGNELARLVFEMQQESAHSEQRKQQAESLLQLNYQFLGYIASLGAHREQIFDKNILDIFDNGIQAIAQQLGYSLEQKNAQENHSMLALNTKTSDNRATQLLIEQNFQRMQEVLLKIKSLSPTL